MSSPTTFLVPEKMSCVNAFYALWKNSKHTALFTFHPNATYPQLATAEGVATLFKTHTYFNYEGGRLLKTDFTHFPTLDISSYDRDFGVGAAQKALEEYNRVHPNERFDKNDSFQFEELTKK